MEADVHGKNITQDLDMSGTISSSPGALSSSFISKSVSHSAVTWYRRAADQGHAVASILI
jgi:TPR repeat protein